MPSVSAGCIYRQKGTKNWSIKFHVDGKVRRESTGIDDREQALAYLERRVDEARTERFVPVDRRITFDEMRQLLLENYRFKRNRTDPRHHVHRLAESFGHLNADEITEERIREYSRRRLETEGMTPGTLRRELAVLKRMLRLASPRLPRVPLVDMPRVDNARQGFFEEEDVQALLPNLPENARNLVEFLYLTGWRVSEPLRLKWADIDWKRRVVLLRDSKNREPRISPFKYHPRLEEVLVPQRGQVPHREHERSMICFAVFHWKGRPIRKLRRSWQTACRAAGLPGRWSTTSGAPPCATSSVPGFRA
ncbi:MAG: hypothetical protein E6K78_07480 [Candidatus Eisenbacteria bacterium]|uniref:Tyr recombinase domain-containing protein n=1 Tax=Eiseniibacteriota bacterium TaxID=2212470 RepID=A0A538TPH1_UNCEI|nr:MAG: hypothetical protein E6K78_07480 [Candidatus Eisenbacteria bacterium]